MTWEVGDLAVCVDASPCACGNCPRVSTELVEGRIYRVVGIIFGEWLGLDVGVGAEDDWHESGAVGARRFRKIKPSEDDFSEMIRKCRPPKQGADA